MILFGPVEHSFECSAAWNPHLLFPKPAFIWSFFFEGSFVQRYHGSNSFFFSLLSFCSVAKSVSISLCVLLYFALLSDLSNVFPDPVFFSFASNALFDPSFFFLNVLDSLVFLFDQFRFFVSNEG